MNEDNNMKKAFRSVSSKKGSYSLVLCIIALVICVVLNLLIGRLSSTATKLDISETDLLGISEQTKQICRNLDTDVSIYLLAEPDSVDSYIQNLINRYADLSPRIKTRTIDYTVNPTFLDDYTDYVGSTDELTINSVLVVSEKRVQYLDYYSIYNVTQQFNPYTGSYVITDVQFKGEEALTSAIDYVTSDTLPIMYGLTGHGEKDLSASMANYVAKENINLQPLSLVNIDSIPEDCSCLFINAPSSDITADELNKIKAYLDAGGGMIIITDYNSDKFENISSLAEFYGISITPGIVLEADADYYYVNRYWLLPRLNSTMITDPLIDNGKYVLVSISHGITEIDHRSSVLVTPLLSTTDKAYSKASINDATTYEFEEGDIEGPFDLAVAITEKAGDKYTKLVWFSSSSVLNDDFNSAVSGGNSDIFLNSIDWMTERESTISIRSIPIETKGIAPTASQSSLISTVGMIAVPAVILLMGLGVWLVRRKK